MSHEGKEAKPAPATDEQTDEHQIDDLGAVAAAAEELADQVSHDAPREGVLPPAAGESILAAESEAQYQKECRLREAEKHGADMAVKNIELRDANSNIKLRRKYARKAHEFAKASLSIWIITIGYQAIIDTATGGKIKPLDDSVLIAITTGCTVNVLAAFLAVVQGLFPRKGYVSPDKSSDEKKK